MHNDNRESLADLAGLPITLNGAVRRWGSALLNGSTIYSLLLEDIYVNQIHRHEIDHLWVRLGATGSSRAARHLPRIHEMRCSMNAVVVPYLRDNGAESYGVAQASRVNLQDKGKTYLLNKKPETVHSEEHGQKEARVIQRLLYERSYESQRELMTQIASRRPPAHLSRAVHRYFRNQEIATPGEIKEARRFLGG